MNIEVESMAIEMPVVEGHPNREGFRGVLTVVDAVSDGAPSGARGHRVVLTRAAAEEAIPSLLGMALDYAPSLDRHDVRTKVGVITRAEIVGRRVEVAGYLYAKDFPEIVREIAGDAGFGDGKRSSVRASGNGLGMSYELTGAQVADIRSDVWILTHVTFTGAAILKREKAAYRDTWIELSQEVAAHDNVNTAAVWMRAMEDKE